MAPSHILQIFLRVTVQNQIRIAQRIVVDEVVQFRPLRHGHVQRILDPGAVNGNVKQKRQWTVCLPVDIPTGWEPRRNLAVMALRVAFADFSAAPLQGFAKSERGPNNSSLFQPLAAVVVVAVQVLLSAVTAKEKLPCKTKKQWTVCLPIDIPTGWEPRAKQQPTGLIAYGAARRRPVQVLLSAVTAIGKLPCKTKKTAIKSCLPCGADKRT